MTRIGMGIVGIVLLVCFSGVKASGQPGRQAAALKQAHDAGVLSDAEYQQKLQALRGSGAGSATAARGGAAPTPVANSASGKGNTWHMKRATYKQNTSLDAMPQWGIQGRAGKNVDAMSMLIPVDWTFQAGPSRSPFDCNMTSGRLVALAISPEKSTGVAIVPGRASIWSNDRSVLQSVQQSNQQFRGRNDCVIEQPQPLGQVIDGIARKLNSKIEITGPMQPVPGLSDKLGSMLEEANRNLAQQGAHVDATAGRIPTRGTEAGVQTEGYFSVLQVVRTQRMQNGATVVTTDYPMQVGKFAPVGKYAAVEPMLSAMLDSVVVDPDFIAQCGEAAANNLSIQQQTLRNLQRIQSQMAADNANAARQQASIRAGVQAYANQVHSSVAANRTAALDHATQQFALHMGDQAIYRDPSTGARVQMSSQYSHAWASGNGTDYILTDSAGYNPNGQVGSAGWTQLQQER